MKTMSASKVRKCFAEALATVVNEGEPLIIVRYSRPIAAVVPMSRLRPAERGLPEGRARRRG